MSTVIQNIATAVPQYAYAQDYVLERMKGWADEKRTRRLLHAIYKRSGIDVRHSVSGDFVEGAEGSLFRCDEAGTLEEPSTQQRNDVYASEAQTLAVEVAGKLLADCDGIEASDVTHVVFASCTGFSNPGPELAVIRELGIPQSVERYTLGFMGCYAAFPALRMAKQFCEANPQAVVMVICLELCSLHIQINGRPDTLLANSLFADGAAAALVTHAEYLPGDADHQPVYQMENFASALIPSGEADMAWDIGDKGFNIVLSSYVPDVIAGNVASLIATALEGTSCDLAGVTEWAIHPGGRSIIDKVANSLGLPEAVTQASREVLRRYGNMSSATILFVLKAMLDREPHGDGRTFAIAFGPGLTVETALMRRIAPAPVAGLDSANAEAEMLAAGILR